MSQQSFISWIRQPASIILIIALLIMFLMLTDQTRQNKTASSNQAAQTSTVMPSMAAPSAAITLPDDLSGQPVRPMGGELPKIVQRLGGPSQGTPGAAPTSTPGSNRSRLTAPDLSSLLGRMEEKVKAESEKRDTKNEIRNTKFEVIEQVHDTLILNTLAEDNCQSHDQALVMYE